MPHHRILWAAGWLLNRCPPSWARFALRLVLEAAYRQRLEGLNPLR